MSRVTVKMKIPTVSQRECFDVIQDRLRDWNICYEHYVDSSDLFSTGRYTSPIEMDLLIDKIIDFVLDCQDNDYDHISGTDFMDGLRTAHPDLYRFSVGYFGGHDFVWRLK